MITKHANLTARIRTLKAPNKHAAKEPQYQNDLDPLAKLLSV